MKRLLFIICIIGIMIGAHSCSNEFDLVDTWKDIPVVYGLLASPDTAHYVRVEKAFLDDNTSAFDIADIIDSLYYDDAAITLIRLSNEQRYPMVKIDGSLEGYPRDTGLFADTPNYLYKLKMSGIDSLRPGERYQLEINRGDHLPLVTGETTIISDLSILAPTLGSSVLFEFDKNIIFQWRFNKEDAVFFDLFLDFHYTEGSGADKVKKVFIWTLNSNIINEDNRPNLTYKIAGEAFYQALSNNIEPSQGIERDFEFIEFRVVAGGQEIYDYIQVNQVNTGITGSQLLPNYTNMSEGYGILSSTNTKGTVVFLNTEGLDSLRNGIYTHDLNFQ